MAVKETDDRFHAGQPGSVQRKELTDKQKRNQELADLKAVLELPQGRRYIRRLLDRCGVFRAPFTPSAQVYYDTGIRSVGVWVWGEIEEADVELLITVLREGSGHSN
jgi:hypothetical protein